MHTRIVFITENVEISMHRQLKKYYTQTNTVHKTKTILLRNWNEHYYNVY